MKTMTDREKDEAVHQSLGRIPGQYSCKRCGNIPISEVTSGGYHDACGSECSREVPKYGECLNAMAEVIGYLRNKNRMGYLEYGRILERIVAIENSSPASRAYHGIMTFDASASQRREAYLRTLEIVEPIHGEENA